ncbi:MAG: PTS sugar transporter subunit IIA, partial [Rhodocyclaceae bacterium]
FVREKLGTTGIGGGIAIPHARIHGLEEAICVFIRLEKSLSFQAIDNKPVDLLFALLVPEDCSEMHLQLLSELATKFSKENFTNSLRLAKDKQRVMELFAMN